MSLPKEAQARIVSFIDGLTDDPRPKGVKKLRDTGLWRMRSGRYRIVYYIDDRERLVIVVRVTMRREDTYKDL